MAVTFLTDVDKQELNDKIDGVFNELGGRKNLNKNVNFVGMSIWWYDGNTLSANGFGGGVTCKGYQTLLSECFNFLSTQNYCYSGFSLGANSDDDTSSIMVAKAPSWSGMEGDIWTLDTITNDFKRNIPIGTIDDYTNATGATTYYGALRMFRDKVRELSGDSAIVICSNALKRNNSGYTSVSENTEGYTLLDYEYALVNVAVRNNWYFVDQYRLSGITDETIMLTTLDGLHLNNFGYTVAIKPWIEQFSILVNKLANESGILFTEPILDSYVHLEGHFVDRDSWVRTDYIKVTEGQDYIYIGSTQVRGVGVAAAVYGYDENKNAVAPLITTADGTNGLLFTVPNGVKYIVCCSLESVTFEVKSITNESGWLELGTGLSRYYVKADGTETSATNWRLSDYIFVNTNGSYKYFGNTSANSSVPCVLGYSASKEVVGIVIPSGNYVDGQEFTIPNNVAYIKYCSVASAEAIGVYKNI